MSGGPMNMEEWQRRMKAEKDAARKKKSESTEILHGYRGGVRDEELKLKKLREEERQRQLDAEQNLRSYQAKELDGIKAMEQKTPRDANVQADASSSATKNYMDGFDVKAGSVSERAAALTSPHHAPHHTFQPNISMDAPVEVHHPAEEAEELIPEPITESVLGEGESGSQEIDAEVADVTNTFADTNAFADNSGVANATSMVAPETLKSERTRTNVLFSFGVVSIHSNPDLTGYMVATEKVVADSIKRQNYPGITYDHETKPFVRTCISDASYIPRLDKSNTKRSLVTAGVPISYDTSLASRAEAKKVIVAALQDAIQSGSFLELAQTAGASK